MQMVTELFQKLNPILLQKNHPHHSMNSLSKDGLPIYPALNIYMSPRVNQQRVNRQQIPLCKYTKTITPDISIYNDSRIPDRIDLKPFQLQDGMIYNFKQISKDPDVKIGSIKILICICMYNEGSGAIQQTLQGIYDNLKYLQNQGIACQQIGVVLIQDGILKLVKDSKRRIYDKGKNSIIEFYKKMDIEQGKSKCELQKRINIILDSIDSFQRKGLSKSVKNNNDFPPNIQKNISLMYQNLWWPSKTASIFQKNVATREDSDQDEQNQNPTKNNATTETGMIIKTKANKITKQKRMLRLFSAFKHTNGTKLSSHLLFFQGFCRFIKPQFCVLLDVGTKPSQEGLLNLIRGFYYGAHIGGCTGLMSIDSNFKSLQGDQGQEKKQQGTFGKLCFSIQRAQQYEYVLAHFLDKNAQSATGFLHVLPGAWSAYRYQALIKTEKYEPNLLQRSYFKTVLNPQLEAKDYQEANMYLAQDRILSLGIYCQMNAKYVLKYVPDAVAYTDPMKNHKQLMLQRRRWINSSLFAFMYVFDNYYYNVMQSQHNCFRKYITLNISMFMALLSFITSYFTPAIYWFILYVTIYQIDVTNQGISAIAVIVSLIYVFLVMTAIAGSLTGRLWTENAQKISYCLSVITIIMYGLVIYNIFFIYIDFRDGQLDLNKFKTITIIVLSIINVVSFIIIVLMHLCTHPKFVCKLLLDQMSYIMFTGAYSQTMVIHGFCNIDDVSWGTKGATDAHQGKSRFFQSKVKFISSWYINIFIQRLFYNSIMAFIFLYIDVVVPQRTDSDGGQVLIAIALYATFIIFVKSVLAIYNHIKWVTCQKCCSKIDVQPKDRKQRVKKFVRQKQNQYMNTKSSSVIY